MSAAPRGKFYSPWCSYLVALLEERELTPADFARVTDDKPTSVHYYTNGMVRPPLKKLELFARKLRLTAPERDKFFHLALLGHTPPEIRAEMDRLRERLIRLEARIDHK